MPLEKLKESNPIENQQRNFGSRTVDYDEIWKNKHDVHGDWEHNLPTLFEETGKFYWYIFIVYTK